MTENFSAIIKGKTNYFCDGKRGQKELQNNTKSVQINVTGKLLNQGINTFCFDKVRQN